MLMVLRNNGSNFLPSESTSALPFTQFSSRVMAFYIAISRQVLGKLARLIQKISTVLL